MAKRAEEVFFQGKGSWFNRLTQGDREFKVWSVKLHFNEEGYSKFMALKEDKDDVAGIMNEMKKDDDGYFHVFKRPFMKNFGKGDEALQPPLILGPDNQPFDWRKNDIGNGSDITVKCECYTFKNRLNKKQGKAIRMVAVRIDNLVPPAAETLDEPQLKQLRGMADQPPQLF